MEAEKSDPEKSLPGCASETIDRARGICYDSTPKTREMPDAKRETRRLSKKKPDKFGGIFRPRAHAGRPEPGRFALIFAVFFLCGFAILLLPPVQGIDRKYSQVLVEIAHALLGLFGGKATVDGAILRAPSGFGIEMKDGCNAINVTILLWAAVIAFPASAKLRLLGAAAGTAAIQAVNIVRFISLFYLGQYSTSWFEFAHAYLWESLIVLDTMVVFGLWVNHVGSRAKASHAGA